MLLIYTVPLEALVRSRQGTIGLKIWNYRFVLCKLFALIHYPKCFIKFCNHCNLSWFLHWQCGCISQCKHKIL